jgi:hypothetical protein
MLRTITRTIFKNSTKPDLRKKYFSRYKQPTRLSTFNYSRSIIAPGYTKLFAHKKISFFQQHGQFLLDAFKGGAKCYSLIRLPSNRLIKVRTR